MKSRNIIKLGFWVVLISALVIIYFLFPSIEIYIFVILVILILYGLNKIAKRLVVRKNLTADQETNASLL
ncbi:MAG: hypothetical protein ACTSRX_02065 [Promethearchaeota archaeon]